MVHLLEEEPYFSDPEDFVDDVTDNGNVIHIVNLGSYFFRNFRTTRRYSPS